MSLDGSPVRNFRGFVEERMHEFSIAESIVSLVLRAVDEYQLIRVDSITVEAGEMRQIVPESLAMAFDALKSETSDTIGSCRLDLVIVPQVVVCRDCGVEFAPQELCYLCPACGSPDTTAVSGNDLVIKSIEGEQRQ